MENVLAVIIPFARPVLPLMSARPVLSDIASMPVVLILLVFHVMLKDVLAVVIHLMSVLHATTQVLLILQITFVSINVLTPTVWLIPVSIPISVQLVKLVFLSLLLELASLVIPPIVLLALALIPVQFVMIYSKSSTAPV